MDLGNITAQKVMVLDCGMEFGECDTIRTVKKTFLSLTIICDLITIFVLVILRKYTLFHQRIFCHILLANLLASITSISSDGRISDRETTNCIAQGFFIQMFDFALFMWVGALTLYIFLKLIKSVNSEMYEWRYMVVCWVVPIVTSLLPFTTEDYGLAMGPFCWINNSNTGKIWRFIVFWIPVFGGVLVILITFIFMICKVSKDINRFRGSDNPVETEYMKVVRDYLKPLTMYAASFVFVHMMQFINRAQQLTSNPPVFGLVMIHTICLDSYGIILCTLFLITNGRREFTLDKFKSGWEEHKGSWNKPPLIQEFEPVQPNDTPVTTLERQKDHSAPNSYSATSVSSTGNLNNQNSLSDTSAPTTFSVTSETE